MKITKKNQKIAKQIIELENQVSKDNSNKKEILDKISKLTSDLSMADMLEIDEYIITKNFLTK